ncbi:MAG: EAL domain-containing protein [Rubrivivax sp.]|nr:EAL domain-containing protein [Rubrivivax sp.]
MPDPVTAPTPLLPTVSIVEETMRQARRAVALALLGAAVTAAVLFSLHLWSSMALQRAADRHAMANKLAGDVRVADQQLALAAQMAALTGEREWIDRFEKLVPSAALTIEHASLLAPQAVAQRYRARTGEAAALLARMQQSATEALNSGAAESARALFDGERYGTQTQLIREASEELTAASLAATEAEVRWLRQLSLGSTLVMLALGTAMGLLLWRRLSSGLSRSRGSLMDAEERIQRLAASDLLTGLDNRAALHDAMHGVIGRARRYKEELAVLMVDLDRFKPVNDRHGHMVGDLVLKEVAQRLARCLRSSDLRARYGGDEFVVVVDEREGPGTARAAAERIVERLSWPMTFGDLTVNIGASVGIARYPADAETDDELLRKADSALYRAKQDGRGGVCLYDAALDEVLSERHTLELALREGIAAGQLVPFYQPIVDLATRQVRSLELLCRWRHPERGLLAPDKFIGLAEDSGLIGELTMSLLRQACKDLPRFPAHWRLSFNVSPQQIQDPSLVPALLAVLQAAGVPPQRLDVELTETALVNDTARARDVILALKRAGMTVTLDDFGTGYSSLSYLAEMTFDKIKIDRSFVRTLRSRPESAKIVHAIVGLSRSLGVDTVAEGVETEEEAVLLQKLGCKNGQGYHFGRPGLAKDVAPLAAVANADAWSLVT